MRKYFQAFIKMFSFLLFGSIADSGSVLLQFASYYQAIYYSFIPLYFHLGVLTFDFPVFAENLTLSYWYQPMLTQSTNSHLLG